LKAIKKEDYYDPCKYVRGGIAVDISKSLNSKKNKEKENQREKSKVYEKKEVKDDSLFFEGNNNSNNNINYEEDDRRNNNRNQKSCNKNILTFYSYNKTNNKYKISNFKSTKCSRK